MEDVLKQKNEIIEDIQMQHIERVSELEAKLKKAAADQKDLSEKLRKSNLELKNEKKINDDIRKEMAVKI